MTPHELNLIVDVYGDKKQVEYEQEVLIAYISEWFHRQESLGKDAYDTWTSKKEEKKQMSDMEMLINIHQLNAALGGKVE
jgi:vacuolar-type H+-ATPase catalytic subunit A/Vma1